MYRIKFKRENPDAILPKKATKGSAAYDAFLPDEVTLHYGRQVIPLGWSLEMPEELSLDSRSRSGYSAKGLLVIDRRGQECRIDADVKLGLIDSDYRNEIGAIVKVNQGGMYEPFRLRKGQAIGQLKFEYVPPTELVEVDELSETERTGGFGKMNNE